MCFLVIPQLQFLSLLSEIDWWSVRCSKCVRSTQVSVFSLCSLILGPQYPPTTPPPYPPPHVCGPGGAGACCPEDRGSAGSQKHLSVPLPLHCYPAGTALSSAPAVCKCVRMCVRVRGKTLERLIAVKQVCVCMSVSQPAYPSPLDTPFWVWLWTHGRINMVAAPLHPQPSSVPLHAKSLTWLDVSGPTSSSELFQVDSSGNRVLCLP